jgi:hypothetical protein
LLFWDPNGVTIEFCENLPLSNNDLREEVAKRMS